MATAGERYFYGTGRRKTAVARVRLYPGTGEILINGKGYLTVFTRGSHQAAVLAPLKAAAADQRFNVQAKVAGRRHHRLGRRGVARHRPRAGRLR